MTRVARRCLLFVAVCVAACVNDISNLPGTFLGSFSFTSNMVFGDGGTTCLVDGGGLAFPASTQFFAQLSLLDGGAVDWQLLNADPVQGSIADGSFSETTVTQALVSPCDCQAQLSETVVLFSDAGFVPGLSQLAGYVDDRLDPENDPDAGSECVAEVDAGLAGCSLACDLIYDVVGVPEEPSGGY